MASGDSLNNFTTDSLTPLWKATSEFEDETDSPGKNIDKSTKTTGYSVRYIGVV